MASQITSLTIVYSIVYSGTDQRKHQSSASLAFVRGIHRGPVNSPHRGPVNSPHKWPVTRKIFPFDDVILTSSFSQITKRHWKVWQVSGLCVWCTCNTYGDRAPGQDENQHQLTHWGKMATIFQTTYSNAFSWMKMYKLRLRFHWSSLQRVQLLALERRQAIIWTNDGIVDWRIYASLGLKWVNIPYHHQCINGICIMPRLHPIISICASCRSIIQDQNIRR